MQNMREKVPQYVLVALAVATVFIWYAVAVEDRAGTLTVALLDIGQGDAIYIESPSGNQIMMDGGPPKAVLRALGRVMPFYDRSLDLLIVSNPDKDHFAGFLDILRSFQVVAVMEPGTSGASAEYPAFEQLVSDNHIQHFLARRGEAIDLGGGATLEILLPDRDPSGMSTNEGSVVAKLTYGSTSFLLTGDAPQNIEHYLVALDGKRLRSDVLKVGHHGSRTSTSQEFVAAVHPAYALISDGKGNSYGHPHQETLDTLAQFNIPVFRTDLQGTIVLTSDGQSVHVEK